MKVNDCLCLYCIALAFEIFEIHLITDYLADKMLWKNRHTRN